MFGNNNLTALLDEYKEGRDKRKTDWKLWEVLLQKHDDAVKKSDWETLEEFLKRGVLKDFKIRKAA